MTNDARAIEQRLLELAYTTDAKLTATALAYFAPCAIEDAARVLEELAGRGTLSMEIEDDGAIVYALPGRTKLGAPALRREVGLAPRPARGRRRSPAAAAMLTALVPGAGHAYAGHAVAAVLWFMAVGVGYALVLPGLLLHVWCMVSAARATQSAQLAEPPRPMLLAA